MTSIARRYTRADLPELKTFTAAQVYEALGSFDHAGMDEKTLILKSAALFDAGRVPGLDQAVKAQDAGAAAEAIYRACLNLATGRLTREAGQSKPEFADHHRENADNVLKNLFTFYDEPHQLPADIDWDFNPGTAHWGHDLNRFTYLNPLTFACVSTGKAEYGAKAIGLILDWIDKADYGKMFTGASRYVFGSYLNQALHISEWARCVTRLLPVGIVTPTQLVRIIKSLHEQIAYLQIVTAGHAGNWPTIGVRGMIPTVARFPVLRDREKFTDYCIALLDEQIAEQVLPDGVQDELTPHYHAVVIANLLEALSGLEELGKALTPRTTDTLRKMLAYNQQTITPSGKTRASFNDSDPDVAESYMAKAAALGFADAFSPPEKLGPAFYPWAGVAFLRQPAGRGGHYMAFDVGPFGRAHQHEDKLSFWLQANGRDLIVDPGRHLYDNSEVSFRAHLKHTRSHSTILIDGQGQNSVGRRDTWISKAAIDAGWSTSENETRARGVYDLGYGPDNKINVTHTREIVFVDQAFWVVFDVVTGEGRHNVDLRFQYAPGRVVTSHADQAVTATTQHDDANLLLIASPAEPFRNVQVRTGEKEPEKEGWYSRRYGLIEPAPNLSLAIDTLLPFSCVTLLLPFVGRAAPSAAISRDKQTANILIGAKSWTVKPTVL